MPWTVKLTKTPTINDFRSDFFPRKFAYKKDAQELQKEVENKGGKSQLIKEKK